MRRGVGQEAPGLSPSNKKSVDDLFADYLQAFIAKDYVKLREYLQAPFISVTVGESRVISNLDGVIAFSPCVIRSIKEVMQAPSPKV